MCVRFLCQAEDGIRDLVRSRGLGDVYKRQGYTGYIAKAIHQITVQIGSYENGFSGISFSYRCSCLLYTSDAADERSSVDLGGRRIIKKKNQDKSAMSPHYRRTSKH